MISGWWGWPRLKEAEEARTLCVSIEGLECSGELRSALLAHADAMTSLYRQLNQLISRHVNDDSAYATYNEQAAQYSSWYKTRKRVANSMRAAGAASSSAA